MRVPADATSPSTFIEALDPDCAQVPENLLRFSVSFCPAMHEGSAAGLTSTCSATTAQNCPAPCCPCRPNCGTASAVV